MTARAPDETLGAASVLVTDIESPNWRPLWWDALGCALVCLAMAAAPASGQPGAAPVPAVHVRELLRQPGVVLSHVQPTPGVGLVGSQLRVTRLGRTVDVPLDGTVTGRRARAISEARLLPGQARALLHLDAEHDASGLLVVDLDAGAVIDAVTAHDLVPSPDGRFWAFEEHAVRTVAVWPHTETVYAVYDAAAPPSANARRCPSADDRCRGQVLFLPDRLSLCRAVAAERGGPCLTPARQPRHVRRSPFVWLSPVELAWVDVDLVRQDSTLVVATLHDGAPATEVVVPLERARVIEDVMFPSAREGWMVDGITRDGDRSRVWLHFRSPVPQAPQRRLGIRVVS